MNENNQSESSVPETGDSPGILKRILSYIIAKVRDHLFGLVLAAAAGFVGGLFWPKPVDVQLQQSGWGEHCPRQVWSAATEAGAELKFVPKTTRHVAICGPGKYRKGDAIEALKSYLLTYQPPCFKTAVEGKKFTIHANFEGEALAHQRTGNDPFITCRCLPDQAKLMFRHRKTICDLSTP